MSTKGFAVINGIGEIDVRTVGPTRIAAIVNGLFTANNVACAADASDALIEDLWAAMKADREVVEVTIEIRELI